MRSGRGLTVALCGMFLGLAACSDGDDPTVLPTMTPTSTQPTDSASPSDSPTADPTPTTTLVLPDEHVPEVDEFVRGFFDAYNAAQDSGDFSAFDAMYLPQCAGCAEMREELEGWLTDGGVVEGADWILLQQSSSALADNYTAVAIAYRTAGTASDDGQSDDLEIDQTWARQVNLFLLTEPELAIADLAIIEAG